MFNRLGVWWQRGLIFTVLWTAVAVAFGWMNLPRARHMPHDPQFESRLSGEALAILRGPNNMIHVAANANPVPGALVWYEDPRIVRMPNGMQLKFPATTTDARAAFFTGEYRQLLTVEAEQQRGPFLLEMLAIWLAPLLAGALAAWLFHRATPLHRAAPRILAMPIPS